MNALAKIQEAVKAPKGQFNNFGKYKYRSCEDIVEAVKPVINPMGFALTITDEVVNIGSRFYIKATATISNGEVSFSATAFAREEESKKGMDGSQVTGASSSYARKYALNGLFAIDDTKDADATNDHEKKSEPNIDDVFKWEYTSYHQEQLTQLLDKSTYDEGKEKKAILSNINNVKGMTEELFNKIRVNLEANQLDPINSGMNYNQGDISRKMRKEIA